MYQKVLHFVKYNNAFTIIFVLCFFSVGISFAASPEIRDGIYSSDEVVVSVDNSFIISADLDNFNFNLRIGSVSEDEKNYYAVYSYQTLEIADGFWQNKTVEKTLTVSKEALDGRDLGLYMAEELGENINYELSYLKRVQKIEREKGQSQKIVTIEYSGLIGKLLDPEEKVIEGYNPVIPEPVEPESPSEPERPATVESNPSEVVVSTPYVEPLAQEPAPKLPVDESTDEETLEQGVASTTPPTESVQEELILPPEEEPTPPPAPEEMVDEELIQEVVEELLKEQEVVIPAPEIATSTPETP